MRVIITEKRSVAEDIAQALGMKAKEGTHYVLNDGAVIVWAYGHLVTGLEPHEYDAKWKTWRLDTLPIIVRDRWAVKPVESEHTKKQLAAIGKLLKKASEVVIATDAGREGELIGREVLSFHGYKGRILRLWLSTMTKADVIAGFKNLKPGKEYESIHAAALARQISDFQWGLSLTRAATVLVGQRGELFPVGRVQTPVLALVVRRDRDIAAFKSRDYYVLEATVTTESGQKLTLLHAPGEENRLYDKAAAERLAAGVSGATAPLGVKSYPTKERAPLGYSLTSLQRAANRSLGLSAKETLEICQRLYESHKMLSYPRTDAEHLGESQKEDVTRVIGMLTAEYPIGTARLNQLGVQLSSRVFDDSQLTDHYAIIPTGTVRELAGSEKAVYEMVVLRFLQMLAPDAAVLKTDVTWVPNGIKFSRTGKVVTFEGWRSVTLR